MMSDDIEIPVAKIRISDIRDETLARVERDARLGQVASPFVVSSEDALLARLAGAGTAEEEQQVLREIGRNADSVDDLPAPMCASE